MATDQQIRSALRTQWHRAVRECTALPEGRWRIDTGGRRLLATLSPAAGQARLLAGYAGGLDVAGELVDGYLAAGPVHADEADAALPVLVRYWLAERADAAARHGDRVALEAARAALEF